jgi:hypothetical protein
MSQNIDIERIFTKLCTLQFDKQLLIRRGVVDINEHLPTLRHFAEQCDHVTEMGTRFAISTYAFLISRPSMVVSYDLNFKFFQPYENEIRTFAKACGTNFEFKQADVLEITIEDTDLLFIDTLHTYNQLSSELERHHNKVRKWIILHDTVTFGHEDEPFYQDASVSPVHLELTKGKTGLMRAMIDFLAKRTDWTLYQHFPNNNGLTILGRI